MYISIIKLVNLQDNIYISAIKYSACDTLIYGIVQTVAILLVLLTVLYTRLLVSFLLLLFSLAFLFSFISLLPGLIGFFQFHFYLLDQFKTLLTGRLSS